MMAYCPECGSEVAPIDTFCPFCGIALQPFAPVGSQSSQTEVASASTSSATDESPKEKPSELSATNVAPTISAPENIVQPAAKTEAESVAPPTPFVLEQEQSAATGGEKHSQIDVKPEELKKDTVENWSMKTDSIELDGVSKDLLVNDKLPETPVIAPEHSIDKDITETHHDSDTEAMLEEIHHKFINSPPPESTPETHQNQKVIEKTDISEEKPFALEAIEIPVKQENAVISEKPVTENFEPISPPPVDFQSGELPPKETDFGATIPYTPEDYAANSLQTDEKAELPESAPSNVESAELSDSKNILSDDEEFKPTEIYSSSELLNPVEFKSEPKAVENNLPNVPASKPETSENVSNSESSKSIEIPDTPIPEPPAVTPVFISILPKEDSVEESKLNNETPSDTPLLSASDVKEEVKESRQFTNPNIGIGDTDGNKAAKLKPLEEGTILYGRYEIVRKIGGGGMGAVYLASDRNLGGVLRAVKEMVQSSIEDEQQDKAINDFKREATILSGLEHPAIPTIFDYFFDEKEGRFYLVMRYISGGDLAARLRSAPEGKIDESTVTDWGIQVADVLDYLHNQQPPIVYRDLKPSNIMIDGNTGRIMLIDFGIARLINADQTDVTAVGTMGYAPPELYRKNVEPRSDIFSLGSTMFHLLTGADPQSNPLLIFDFNKNPRPRQINSLLSDQIEQILMRAVELDSANRFSSAAEMRDALKTHLDNLLKGAVTYGVVKPSANVQAASTLPVFCGFCGQKIVATDQFCPFCGSQQPTAGQSSKLQQTPIFTAPKKTARLLIIGTNELEAPEFSLDKENNLVGRRDPMSNIFPEVDLSKFDPQTKISRKHARIWRESNVYMLEDLGSSNGTVIISPVSDNVRLLPRQPHVLANGDKIKVGDTTLHFFVG